MRFTPNAIRRTTLNFTNKITFKLPINNTSFKFPQIALQELKVFINNILVIKMNAKNQVNSIYLISNLGWAVFIHLYLKIILKIKLAIRIYKCCNLVDWITLTGKNLKIKKIRIDKIPIGTLVTRSKIGAHILNISPNKIVQHSSKIIITLEDSNEKISCFISLKMFFRKFDCFNFS